MVANKETPAKLRVVETHSEKGASRENCTLRKAGIGEPPHLYETFRLRQNEKAERIDRTLARDWRCGKARESETGRAEALPSDIRGGSAGSAAARG